MLLTKKKFKLVVAQIFADALNRFQFSLEDKIWDIAAANADPEDIANEDDDLVVSCPVIYFTDYITGRLSSLINKDEFQAQDTNYDYEDCLDYLDTVVRYPYVDEFWDKERTIHDLLSDIFKDLVTNSNVKMFNNLPSAL